jgi:hypothetical protein
MKRILLIILIASMAIGSYCKAQDLKPVQGANGQYGYVDSAGKEVVPFKYNFAWKFPEGLAMVRSIDKYGFIDGTGKEIIPCKYSAAKSFSEGLAAVKMDGKYGFINKVGKVVIPFTYDDVYQFNGGKAYVEREVTINKIWVRQFNYISKNGTLLSKWKESAPQASRPWYD